MAPVLIRQIRSFLIVAGLLLSMPHILLAEEKPRIAVLDLSADGVPDRTARTISNMLRTDLVNTGAFTVVERGQMEKILNEQGFQQTGCTEQDCAVKVGQMLSAHKMLIGEVSELKDEYYITIRIVDVELGKVDFADREVSASNERLESAINRLATRLSAGMTGKKREAPKVKKKEDSPPIVIVKGDPPTGWWLTFNYFSPTAAEFKKNYSSLMGLEAGYLMPFGQFMALTGSARAITGANDKGDSRASFSSAAIGARAGVPLFSFMYPYIGASLRTSWIYEQGKYESANFMAWGGDAHSGFVFVIGSGLNIFVQYSYEISRVTDERSTDAGGMILSGGVIARF